MQNSKIIRLLKCFNPKEIREFRKFVSSPYHNNRKIVIKFYDTLKEYYPDFESVNGDEIYCKVFPGRKFKQGELVRLSSYLFKLGRDFIVASQVKKNEFNYNTLFLEGLDELYADYFFEKEYENAAKWLNSRKMHNQSFLAMGTMEVIKIDFLIRRNRQKDIGLSVIKNIEQDIFQLITKLVIRYGDMLAHRAAYNYNYSNTTAELFINNFDFDGFISNLKTDEAQYYNFMLCYYYQFKVFTEPGNEYYFKKLREYSFKDSEKLTAQERGTRYIRLFGYSIGQILRGNLEFLRTCFEFHKEAFENKLYNFDLLGGDFIYPVFFRNFVVYGLAAKEYDYIEKFIAQSGGKLREEYRNDMISVSSAMLQFEKKCYAGAIELLNKVRFSYPSCQMDTKSIYIKAFYETDDYESLFTLIDSFKHYLKRDSTIRDVIRNQNLSFLNYTNKLAKIKGTNNDGIYELHKSINGDIKVDPIHKLWLIEKSEELLE